MSARRGAVVLRVGADVLFVPAGVALEIAPLPKVTRVHGAPAELLGIALHDGDVLPVLSIGPERGVMLVCTYLGEALAIVGGEVLHAGILESSGEREEHVMHEGVRARLLDVGALYARVQTGGWAGRLAG